MDNREFKSIRHELGLTLSQLSEVLGVDSRTIRKWEGEPGLSTSRPPNPVAARVMGWMRDVFPPAEFPKKD